MEKREKPGNWKAITVTSVIYRALFCRIAHALYEAHELQGISIFDIEQKDFVAGRARCVEHTAVANAIINDVVEKRSSYIYYPWTLETHSEAFRMACF
jgi:hypothetical protein